jgi:hypothetical protein
VTAKYVLGCKIQAGVPTPDWGHIYSRALLERELQRIVTEQGVGEYGFSSSDYPTAFRNITHKVSRAWVEPNGEVRVEVEILDTPKGIELLALCAAQKTVLQALLCGVGTLAGATVQDDYRLGCINIVDAAP